MSAIEYSYDAVGNRTQKVENGITTTYVYDAANQLVQSQTGSSTTTYLYDLNGNLLSETTGSSVTSYEWDEENRLAKVTYPDGSSEEYIYSADGLRKKKVVTNAASVSETTLFLWDGQNVLLETDENKNLKARYTNAPDEYAPMLSMQRGAVVSHYGFDTLSNARVLVDDSQSVTDSYTYSGFGQEQSSSGTTANPHRFGGEVGYYADKLSRIYIRARHYQPQNGRWMSNDPIGYDGGDGNLYRYVQNNPVSDVDPRGLAPTDRLSSRAKVLG